MKLRDRLRVCRRDGAQRDHWQVEVVEEGHGASRWWEVRHLLLGTEYREQWLECDGYWVLLPRRFCPVQDEDRIEGPLAVRSYASLHAARRDAVGTISAIDGRLQPRAWLVRGDGAICKTARKRGVTVVWTEEARQEHLASSVLTT